MFDYDSTIHDEYFYGPLIRRAVSDATRQRSPHAIHTIIARAVHEARNGGASELARDLHGVEDAMHALGVSRRRVQQLARELHDSEGLGALIGGAWIFRSADIERMRKRLDEAAATGKGRARGKRP